MDRSTIDARVDQDWMKSMLTGGVSSDSRPDIGVDLACDSHGSSSPSVESRFLLEVWIFFAMFIQVQGCPKCIFLFLFDQNLTGNQMQEDIQTTTTCHGVLETRATRTSKETMEIVLLSWQVCDDDNTFGPSVVCRRFCHKPDRE